PRLDPRLLSRLSRQRGAAAATGNARSHALLASAPIQDDGLGFQVSPAASAKTPAPKKKRKKHRRAHARARVKPRATVRRAAHDDDDDSDADGNGHGLENNRRGTFLTHVVAISLSLGMSTRRLALERRAPAANGRYEGSPFPEMRAAIVAFPLALATKSFWRNVGISLSYSQDVSASSKLSSAAEDLETSSRELLLDLVLRWRFGGERFPLQFKANVGWGLRDFSIGENNALMTLNYRFVRFGAGVQVPLGTPLLALGFSADVRALYSVGDEALAALGTRNGGAFAFAVRPGISGRTKLGIFYFATFELLRFTATFQGLEAGAARQGSADSEDVTNSTDQFLRFWVGGGYAF
ncbi:MAG: hypothetical protein KC503_22715, partial [Myxococcales bacterium]|nr:hypothetical protein [Myxococcales bacterium]